MPKNFQPIPIHIDSNNIINRENNQTIHNEMI
mgnify:CR=1 FL=1